MSQDFAFSTYLTYQPAMSTQSFAAVTQQYNAVAAHALTGGSVTDTGRAYQRDTR